VGAAKGCLTIHIIKTDKCHKFIVDKKITPNNKDFLKRPIIKALCTKPKQLEESTIKSFDKTVLPYQGINL
jgi:hypothetical protein